MARDPYANYKGGDPYEEYTGGDPREVQGVLKSNMINGVFGMPYQFLPSVDARITSGNVPEIKAIGRKYSEKIAARLPLLFLVPCRQKFMKGFNKSDIGKVLSALTTGANAEHLLSTVEGYGRYYDTEYAYPEYYECVNRMCAQVAGLLGIKNRQISLGGEERKSLGTIDWRSAINKSFRKYYAAKQAVVFYTEGLSSMSDSFNNSTAESSLASTINGYADQAKEIQFLLGPDSLASQFIQGSGDIISGLTSTLGGLATGLIGSMLGDLAGAGVSAALQGGKIIFPKLWGDSQYSRSYSFSIKLRSPDHDSVSIFMNILVPFIHLLALTLPQSITRKSSAAYQSPNAYQTPFLVRAYARGQFSITDGMITDLSCTRGAECQWNDDGLPTQMDVDITIEDLYSSMLMSNIPGSGGSGIIAGLKQLNPFSGLKTAMDVVSNTAMLDYLSNLSGLNVAAESLGRRLTVFKVTMDQSYTSIGSNLAYRFDNSVNQIINDLMSKIL